MATLRFLGIMLSSSWINMMLFAWEILLIYEYFFRFWKGCIDIFHVLVCSMLVADIVGTIAVCAGTWLYLVTYDADPIKDYLWSIPLLIVATGISALLEQVFLIYRFYTLSRATKTTALLVTLATTHTALMTVCAVHFSIHPVRTKSGIGTTAMIFGGSLSAIVDLLIPSVLIWRLHQIRGNFTSTQGIIRRVSIQAVTSGALVAVLGVVAIVSFTMVQIESLIFWSCLGRVYSITVLINLLGRKNRHLDSCGDAIEFAYGPNGSLQDPCSSSMIARAIGSRADKESLFLTETREGPVLSLEYDSGTPPRDS